ncbi:MAG: ImmA/IrrE family metallo-endopeptidase [Veillonellaceae bacterium]|uniref:ImmA/IrrE family metallo-endopeptidase n=1 Tax=uncultured Selenomonas sp. TaxID=159275 RepID=UPI0025DF1814|nr:ImmA/IrrE family metallo-endopeptidase [uncultured Selenomonas sp.]MDD6696897.1 ImmA/IrrE family metallo-endopeptidase [Veillonellaceae bacterium]
MRASKCYELAQEARKLSERCDPLEIAEGLGIHVLFEDDYKDLLGMYYANWGNRFIFLNNRLDDIWMPMVLAHEIGHDQLHRDLARQTLQEFNLFQMQSRTEYEANAFAAHLLLENDEVYDRLREGCDVPTLAKEMNVNINLMLIKLQEMAALGYDLRVSDCGDSHFFKNIHT